MRQRLDEAAVARGFFSTRSKAQAYILAGEVLLNGKVETKAGAKVKEGDAIELAAKPCPYVSRGGLKLKAALDFFKISVRDRICADIGASTGGFTDCLLAEGAAKVFAVDVGKGQFDCKLLADPRVVFLPGTNARHLTPPFFREKYSFAAIDVSFISLTLVLLPVLNCLAGGGEAIALIKPQFELTPKQVPKGIVREDAFRLEAVEKVRNFLAAAGKDFTAKDMGILQSPLKGAHGNIEYLWHISKLSVDSGQRTVDS